jgi:signal transduction histidine kinase
MNKTSFAPIPNRRQEMREGIGAGIAFLVLFGLHVLILRPALPRTTLLWYALLTLALAGVYIVSGLFGMMQRISRGGTTALLPVFLLGNGLILAIALTLWGRTLLYFCLFMLNGYGALVHYTGRRRWALVFAGGMVAFAWVIYALLRGWPAAGPAWLGDLPWYALTFALAEIVARQREHREQVEALAAELARANRQLQDYAAQTEELAIIRERARLAHELHDTVGHTLTALDVQLELLARLPSDQAEQRQQAAGRARTLVKDGLADVRRAVQALRPAALETFSLPEAIAALAAGFEQAAPIQTTWQVIGEARPLSPRLALPLYRAAQEALTNIRRHAPAAQHVTVSLRYEPGVVSLCVTNDGVAPTPPPGPLPSPEFGGGEGVGYGLRGLRERAEALGGAFSAGPDGAGGFQVEMTVPAPNPL